MDNPRSGILIAGNGNSLRYRRTTGMGPIADRRLSEFETKTADICGDPAVMPDLLPTNAVSTGHIRQVSRPQLRLKNGNGLGDVAKEIVSHFGFGTHLDPVAVLHETGPGLAEPNGFDGAALGDAA